MNSSLLRLIICESSSGIILNENLEYHDNTDPDSKSLFYFKNLVEAKKFIESLYNRPNTSFEVYDNNMELQFHLDIPSDRKDLHPPNETKPVSKSSWWKFW